MTHDTTSPTDGPEGRPVFDPQRSAEIRRLLIRTVAGTPRPRLARLSRPAFALAATVALLCAGGVGAGTVVAYDGFVRGHELSAQSASDQTGHDSVAEAAADSAVTGSAVTDSAAASPPGLSPVLMLNGETGYAYDVDLNSFEATSASGLPTPGWSPLSDDGEVSDSDLLGSVMTAARVPIYRADGVTVIGYIEPRTLAR